MVSAKTMANGYQPLQVKRGGKQTLLATNPKTTTNLFLPFFSTTKRVKICVGDNIPPPAPVRLGIAPVCWFCEHLFVGVCAFVRVWAYICSGEQVFVVGVPDNSCVVGRPLAVC